MNLKQGFCIIVCTMVALSLASCAALTTEIKHRDLNVQSKMSPTVFLPPVSHAQKTVYVDIHNTSGQSNVNLTSPVDLLLRSKGYRVVTSPSNAHYLLQANILQIGKSSQTAADAVLGGGYGSALSGAALGAGLAATTGGDGESMIGAGVLGGLGSTIADTLVTDNIFTIITDIQISAKLAKGDVATSQTVSNTSSGSGTHTVIRRSGSSQRMQYRTRIVSTADKANLKFVDAKPVLIKQLAHSISNIF